MAYVPEGTILVSYTIACLVLFLTPGPDMSLFLARTLTGGVSAGIASMLGASLGCAVHTLLAAAGISAILAASPRAFAALKVVGALYLLWLAIDAVRRGSVLRVAGEGGGRRPSFLATLGAGLAVNLTNPKVVLFYVTFLPQFVSATDPAAPQKLVFLGLYYVVLSLPFAVLMIVAAERLIAFLKRKPAVLRAIDWTFAGVFGFFAVSILVTEGR